MGQILHKKIDYTGISPYKFVPTTKAAYDALSQSEKMDNTKIYLLTDVNVASARIDDTDTSTGKVWSSQKVSDEIDGVLPSGGTDMYNILTKSIDGTLTWVNDFGRTIYPSIADLFSSQEVYNKGSICNHNGIIYKCKENNVTGNFDDSKWDIESLGNCIKDNTDAINSNIIAEVVSKTSGFEAIASGASAAISIPCSKSGYSPIGIVSIYGSGTTNLALTEYYISGSNAIAYYKNTSSSSKTLTTLNIRVLYKKN